MKTKTILQIISVLLTVIMTLTAVLPAYADTPYHEMLYFDGEMPWFYEGCGFPVVVKYEGNVKYNYWLDENGNLSREIYAFPNLKAYLSANGKTLKYQISGPLQQFISDDQVIFRSVGTADVVTMPEYGKVVGGGGQYGYELKLDKATGEWVFYPIFIGNWEGNFDPVCQYLAP